MALKLNTSPLKRRGLIPYRSKLSFFFFFGPICPLMIYQYLAKRFPSVPSFSLSIFRHILFFLPKIGSLLYHLSPYSLYFEYFYFFLKIGCALFLSYVPLFSINIASPFFFANLGICNEFHYTYIAYK